MLVPVAWFDTVALKLVWKDSVGAQPMSDGNGAGSVTFADAVERYIDWGKQHGRSDSEPWSIAHQKNRGFHLTAWSKHEGVKLLTDVSPLIYEQHVTEMKRKGAASKYCRSRTNALHGLMNWCVKNKLLTESPIKHCRQPSDKARKQCRAFTFEEFSKFLSVAPAERRLLYRVAVLTGFRRGELRSLACGDVKDGVLHLAAANEKTRCERWFPLTPKLSAELELRCKGKPASESLLSFKPQDLYYFNQDLKAAGIEKNDGGVLDFHGIRRTGITWLGILGAPDSVRHAFSRHSDTQTIQRYDLASQKMLRAWIVKMEQALQDEGKGAAHAMESAQHSIGHVVSDSPLIDVTIMFELAFAYSNARPREKAFFRRLSKRILARKFGGKS